MNPFLAEADALETKQNERLAAMYQKELFWTDYERSVRKTIENLRSTKNLIILPIAV